MTDLERQVKELPRPVSWLGSTLGGLITGVHARFDRSMLEKMEQQASFQIAFFGRCPEYIDWAHRGLDERGRERLSLAVKRGQLDRARNEALMRIHL